MRRLLSRLMLLSISVCCVASAHAQIFYEPVQYQYGSRAGTFYYGGHDPRMFEYAATTVRSHEYSSVVTRRHVVESAHVFSDGYRFSDLGDNSCSGYASFTPNDARNEANANVPRYFRKHDLLNAAVVTQDGSWVVPAHSEPQMDIKVVKPFGTTVGPVVPKGTILVIPRKWLEKPVKLQEPSVATAR